MISRPRWGARVAQGSLVATLALTAAALPISPAALAQPKGKTPSPPKEPEAPTHTTSLVFISTELAKMLGSVPSGALVVASPIASDLASTKLDELSTRVAAMVAGKVGDARAHGQPASLSVARALSGRAASLLYLQVEIVKGNLRVTADLYPVVSNAWDRLRNPAPGPRAHGFSHAPLDAEIRAFFPPVVLEHAKLHRAKHDEGEVLALGCGDVDGDGGLELVIATRRHVTVGKIRGPRFVPSRSVPWSSLASRVAVPLREPLASVLVAPRWHDGEIWLGSTDRGGVVTDGTLSPRRSLAGLPIAGAGGRSCVVPVAIASALDGVAVACDPDAKETAARSRAPSSRVDAIAALDVVGKDGAIAAVVATREPSGKLVLQRDDAKTKAHVETTLDNVGAQIALGDLDLDGVAEIVTSASSGEDAIVVQSFGKATPTPRLRFAAREGVRALAVCPPEERGVPALVAAVGSEVWLVR